MAYSMGSGLRTWGLLSLLAAGLGVAGCGKAADSDRAAGNKGVSDRESQEAELAALDDGAALLAADAEAPAPAPQCGSSSTCRGGLLAGSWEIVADCTSEPEPRRTLQTFGKPFLTLDSAACPGALQLDTEWSGGFKFELGLFEDQRGRADHVQLDLTAECLSATLGKAIDERHLGSACASLGKNMSQCAVADGVCHCSGSSEAQLDRVSLYGVLNETQVVIASQDLTGSEREQFDYCVEGDLLHWRQQTDGVELVLRRLPPPELADPPQIH
jgi:hypothetical protein